MNNTPIYILLADDDESDRLLFVDAFEELALDTLVQIANNGVELMDFLTKAENDLPHLIFLDLNMPIKNGLECLKEIRSNTLLKDIPVAIYSTSASEDDMEQTFLAGANIYIKKPTDYSSLKKVLEKAITATFYYQLSPFDKSNFLLRI